MGSGPNGLREGVTAVDAPRFVTPVDAPRFVTAVDAPRFVTAVDAPHFVTADASYFVTPVYTGVQEVS